MLANKGRILFLVIALGLLLKGPVPVAAAPEDEQIKALYLYNFLLFVDWPEQVLRSGDPFRVAVAGDTALFHTLSKMAKNSVKGRGLLVERFDSPEDLPRPCHAVYIGASERDLAALTIMEMRGRPVLTLSDMAGFTDMGGMVHFKHIACKEHASDHPKRFEINLSAMKRAGLKIRSRLLRLSDIVE
ncbi:MAG: YfiR family protein [Candidatus Desulfacyla sp.]